MNCSNCKQRHYAPTGSKCPYKIGQELPTHVLPSNMSGSEGDFDTDIEEDDFVTYDQQESAQESKRPTKHQTRAYDVYYNTSFNA